MIRTLRVLLVEDDDHDADLLLAELRRGGFATSHLGVAAADAMKNALITAAWDLIVCDYSMPYFSAGGALRVLHESGLDIPIIVVSGIVDEDKAIEVLRAGAHDFMSKGRLSRLIPAIERELREVTIRSERRKMQQLLLVAERMASMGTLASGVVHEINNPLAAVIANLHFVGSGIASIERRLGRSVETDELREVLDDATQAAERIRDVVRDLRLFSRGDQEPTEPIDVERVMESTLRMASNELRHRARVVKLFGKVDPVEASESRLGQVFLNLLVNAAQAIPEGRSDENEVRISTRAGDDGRVVIEIADTGPGIPPDILDQLFTPFVTTKPPGIGTGLGLSICHRIIDGFGGTIDVTSVLGKGTTFRVSLLPARSEVAPGAPPPAPASLASKRGRILVIDDEPAVAKAVHRTLAREHEVIVVDGAALALQRLGDGERFDVILCDLMMPVMTGMDLHRELLQLHADHAARVIFLTGGAFTAAARGFLENTTNLRIEKPFDPMQLRTLVSERLRATARAGDEGVSG